MPSNDDESLKLLADLAIHLYGDKEKAKAEIMRCLGPRDPNVIPLMRNPNPCCIRDKVPMTFPMDSTGTVKYKEN